MSAPFNLPANGQSPPFAMTLAPGSSLPNKTGSWRTKRPVYVDRLPLCNEACGAGENIQEWLYLAQEGEYEAAWRVIMRDNPLPAVMGRVCYHPCETACNRKRLGSDSHPVNIHAVERFLGDEAIRHGWMVAVERPPTGKHVLVVGAGPSGLSCAYQLALMGHRVTVREAGPAAGGMMRFGIPKYRLPRDVLDAEVARIAGLGVAFEYNARVGDLGEAMAGGGFDAVYLAVGAHVAKRAYIPAGDASRILDAIAMLRGMEVADTALESRATGSGAATPAMLGRRVLVYGGGNTAMDAARTAKRLGAIESIVVYRRTREKMPAHDFEVTEAAEEGVQFKWLSTITSEKGGVFTVEKMRLDGAGKPQPTGEFETLEGDALVLALGQDVDLSFLSRVEGMEVEDAVVKVGPDMMTGHRGVFAGGDMAPGDRTVTVAVGHGKKAARNIDAYLRGGTYTPAPKHERAAFADLNTWYYTEAPRAVQPVLDMVRRQSTFDEVVGGLDAGSAVFEARRCLSCGNCLECDNCYGLCPDNAIVKLAAGPGGRYRINYDYCKGCGLCAAECPCGAIRMEEERM